MTTVLIHPFSSLLSAYGMGLAAIRATRQQALEEPLAKAALEIIAKLTETLGAVCRDEVEGQGVPQAEIELQVRAHIRYSGTDSSIEIEAGLAPDITVMRRDFEAAHLARFGFNDPAKSLVIEALSIEAVGGAARIHPVPHPLTISPLPAPVTTRRLFSQGKAHQAKIFRREQLAPGHRLFGPALVIEDHQTIVVEDGWDCVLTGQNHLVLTRIVAAERNHALGTKADPVLLEIFNNLFMSIAEQMGVTLQNTAYSVNIKERLDFSCAVFDSEGNLVANAPHMPCISDRWTGPSKRLSG